MAYFHTSCMKMGHFSSGRHKQVIYQLVLRLFSNTKTANKPYGTIRENGCGKFADITPQVLQSLKDFGVTAIWYTGVLEHATLTDYTAEGMPADDPRIVKGRAGSPYAIRDYYDVDPDLAEDVSARMEECEDLFRRTRAAGLRSLIDFVPNHVARSYHSDRNPGRLPDFGVNDDTSVLFHPRNDFLYLPGETFHPPADYQPLGGKRWPSSALHYREYPARVTGNDVYSATPSSNDWFETVKLNFGVHPHPPHPCFFDPVPPVWEKLLDILLYWAAKGVDGFRCDMAEMVPAEFWEWVIPCVKTQYPDVIFIAEIYKPELYLRYLETGYFDYLYDKVSLYDTLVGILKGHTPADEITRCARSIEQHPEQMLSFLENHDEERLASPDVVGDAGAVLPAMAICALLSKGPVMVYFGQESGETGEGNVGFAGERRRTSIFDYCGVPAHQQWYNKGKCDGGGYSGQQHQLRAAYKALLRFAVAAPAICDGGFYDLQYINRHHQSEGFDERYLYAFLRHASSQKLLIVVNFSKTGAAQLHLRIPPDALHHIGLGDAAVIRFKTVLGGEEEVVMPVRDVFTEGDRYSGLPLQVPAKGIKVIHLS